MIARLANTGHLAGIVHLVRQTLVERKMSNRGDKRKKFMRRCKAGLKDLPKKECIYGRNKICPWWVMDSKAKYCLWVWLEMEENQPGGEKVNTYHKIGKALGLTGSAVHQHFRHKIRKKLREILDEEI